MVLHLFFQNKVVCRAVKQNHSNTEQQPSPNISKPMDTAYKPPDYHKRRKQTAQGINGISNSCVLNQAVELHHSSGQYAHGEHGCGRWVGYFQNTVYQNRAAVDHMELKKHISAEYEDVKCAKNQDAAVNFPDMFSFDPLR